MARVMYNLEPKLALEELSFCYLDAQKLDIKTYIEENGLLTKVKKFGDNKEFLDFLHYERVPLKLMYDYGIRDTSLCRKLGLLQIAEIKKLDEKVSALPAGRFPGRKVSDVLDNERALTKVFFDMEREGVLIDRAYTEEAYNFEVSD